MSIFRGHARKNALFSHLVNTFSNIPLFRLNKCCIGLALYVLLSTSLPAQEERESGTERSSAGSGQAAGVMRGFRFDSRAASAAASQNSESEEGTATSPASESEDESATGGTPLPSGAMSVGRVEGSSRLPPESAKLLQEAALAATEQRWSDAQRLYQDFIRQYPENALGYANLGVVEYELGNLLAAAANLGRSVELDSTLAGNWQTLGLIHYSRGDLNLALSTLTRAIHEEPQDAYSRLYLAAVVRDYGWEDAAITELKRALELDPDMADAHYNLAVTYLDMNPPKLELARRHYFEAKDLGAEPSTDLEKALDAADTP
ncbi:MAG: tetratricopeptide repeat protein [Verrucomicrobiota bacterium]